jgi:hypothetical protein
MSWCRAQSGTFHQIFFYPKVTVLSFGAPSLSRSRVCYESAFVIEVYNSQLLFTKIFKFKLKIYNTIKYLQYIQGLFQSRLSTADYALVTSSLHYNHSLDT